MKFLTAIVALGLAGCNKQAATLAPREEAALVVPAARAERADLSGKIVLTAEFEPYQEIDVMAKVSGYVKTINVDVGDRVRSGQLLATLEVPEMADDAARGAAAVQVEDAEIAALRDEVHRVESNHDMSHLSYTRIEAVSRKEKGLVPQQEVDEAHARDLAAEAQIAEAGSKLRAAEQRMRAAQAEESRIGTMLKYTSIAAPFDGVVTRRFANTGSLIQAGTSSQTQAMPLVRLSQNNRLRLVLPVPESAVSRIRLGQTLDIRVSALGRTIPGQVARFTGSLQMATRTMDTQVDVPNPNLTVLPGMYAEVDLNIDERRNVVTIPLDAVEGTGAAAHVFALKNGNVQTTPVTVGLETAQKVEILHGLQEGDIVITGRHAGLKDGQKVTPKLAGAES